MSNQIISKKQLMVIAILAGSATIIEILKSAGAKFSDF